MIAGGLAAAPARTRLSTLAARLSLGLGLVALIFVFVRFLVIAAAAVRFPYQRDYGEGIVWQQMRLMFEGKGYAPIDGFPAIVFHYPPLYHATVEALSFGTGIDALLAGRLVSLIAALASAVLIGAIASLLARQDGSRAVGVIGGVFAGLAAIALPLVQIWALVMRVDMLAIALSLAGTWFGIRAISRPGAIYGSSLCFVAAFFTKQTSIAAPAALFATLLLVRPQTAWRGIATAAAAGSTVLAGLFVATDGGIVRHLILYNINRFDVHELGLIPAMIRSQWLFFAAVAVGLAQVLGDRLSAYRARASWRDKREELAQNPRDIALLVILLYFAAKTLMTLLVAKSGANANYLMEWMMVGAIFIGPAVSGLAAAAIHGRAERSPSWLPLLVPVALAVPAFAAAASPVHVAPSAAELQHRRDLDRLSALVRAAPRPVISDDMVMLLRSGKEVLWEPAIFGELASTGAWDERPFVALIRARRFSFFITEGDRGDPQFDSRYTPRVDAALEQGYPRRCRLAGYVIHLPEAQETPRACRLI